MGVAQVGGAAAAGHGAAARPLVLRNVRPQNADLVFQALRWAAQGMDLADALHLALSSKAEGFATFDEQLVKQAGSLGVQPPVFAP